MLININFQKIVCFLGQLESQDVDEEDIGNKLIQSAEESGNELVSKKNSRKLKRSIQQSSPSFEDKLHPTKRQKDQILSHTVSQSLQKKCKFFAYEILYLSLSLWSSIKVAISRFFLLNFTFFSHFQAKKSRKETDSGLEASSGIDGDSESIISKYTNEKEPPIDSNLLLKLVQQFKIQSIRLTNKSQLRQAWSDLATQYDKMRQPNLYFPNLIRILQKYYNENNVMPLSLLKSWRNEADNQSVSEDLEVDELQVVGGRRGKLLLVGKENAFKK